jgi:hypothetical protein
VHELLASLVFPQYKACELFQLAFCMYLSCPFLTKLVMNY